MEQPYQAQQGSAATVVAVLGRDSHFHFAGVGCVLLCLSTRLFLAHNSPVAYYSRLGHLCKSFSEAEEAEDRISTFGMPSSPSQLVQVVISPEILNQSFIFFFDNAANFPKLRCE